MKSPAPKAWHRADIILSIVATDNTFHKDQEAGFFPMWVGRCLHCNAKVYVNEDGFTMATVEHIQPLCNGGHPSDPRNCALACPACNNEKGVRHDKHAGKGGRADEVIAALQEKRARRWRDA